MFQIELTETELKEILNFSRCLMGDHSQLGSLETHYALAMALTSDPEVEYELDKDLYYGNIRLPYESLRFMSAEEAISNE